MLLVDAARDANLHRSPDALRAAARAQEQSLADLYLSNISRPPEPTNDEIDVFILENPYLFTKREIVDFLVLSLPSASYNEAEMTPLFDTSSDFAAMGRALERAGIEYRITPTRQPGNFFPTEIRRKIASYQVSDNIVILSEAETQIMKITAKEKAPISRADAYSTARAHLLNERTQARALSLVESLKRKSKLTYYRASAVPEQPPEK